MRLCTRLQGRICTPHHGFGVQSDIMHPRNRYCHSKPDFGELAEAHPPLKPFLIRKRSGGTHSQTQPGTFAFTIDFSNPAALRELTCALLARDFGLKLEIPLDKLIPTIPLRLNYIHWVEDLLSSSSGSIPHGDTVVGVDIGTGASCIYPLLGARLNGWRFLATEVEEDSARCARENVVRNALEDKISVKQVAESTVLEGALEPSVRYHFCMCNPPFFKDQAERYGNQSRSGHRPLPGTASTGVAKETVTEGGEVQFVRRMVADSLRLRDTVRWYTSMLGKKASLKAIQTEIKKHQIPVMTTTEFVQGKTWRWAVAWSFDETLKEMVRQPHQAAKKDRCHRPFKLMVSRYQPTAEGFQKVLQWLQGQLSELQISYDIGDQTSESICLNCLAQRNTWSHQRKRRRLLEKLKQQHTKQGQEEVPEDTATVSGGSESSLATSIGPQTQVETYTNTCTAAAQSFGNITTDLHPGVTQECPSVAADSRRKDISSQGSDKSVVMELDSGCTTGSDTDTAIIPSITSSEFSRSEMGVCCATTGKSKQKPPLLPTSFKETAKNVSQQSLDEIDPMSTPCRLGFQCSMVLGSTDELPCTQSKKRRKCDGSTEAVLTSGSGNRKSGEGIILSFELIRGEDKDSLHQIVQYIKNKLQLLQ